MAQTAPAPKATVVPARNKWIGRAFLLVLGLLALWLLGKGLLENPTVFAQNIADGFKLGFVYALIALGYTMVYGIVKLINFAHGDVFMVGAYTSYYAIARWQLHRWPAAAFPGLPEWLVLLVGTVTVVLTSMTICPLIAVTIERLAYKPLRDAPRISALITAIGVSFFLEYFGALQFVFSPQFYAYPRAFDVAVYDVFGVTITNITLIIIASSLILLALLNFIVRRTKIGKAMRASSFDKPTARLMGINVDVVISITFAIGAALAGAGGVLYATAYPRVAWSMGIYPGLKAFVAAVLGGIGSIPGALTGALIMGQAEMLSAGYISTPMRDAIAFTILILVLLIRPTGIFGEPEREKA